MLKRRMLRLKDVYGTLFLLKIKNKFMKDRSFTLLVDAVPIEVTSIPFKFNTETRYKVSYNNSPEIVFTWDSSLGRLAAIGDESSTMPDGVEIAIAEKIQSGKY